MDGPQVEAATEGADITEHTVTKTMTPRIDELVPCVTADGIGGAVDVVKNDSPVQRDINKSPHPNSGDEKCDADPENSRKSCDVTPDTADEISLGDLDGAAQNSPQTTTRVVEDNATTKQDKVVVSPEMSKSAMAFTIDFNDGKQVDSKKYNDIFERFQKRHRRGASMSKLEDTPSSASGKTKQYPQKKGTSTPSKTPLLKETVNSVSLDDALPKQPSVLMRDKSRQSRKDTANAENRHSWSPRNSMQPNYPAVDSPQNKLKLEKTVLQKANSFQPKSDTLQRAFSSIKDSYNLPSRPNRMDKQELVVCEAPPLEYVPTSSTNDDGSASSVSEAGTYTLDGDNYTEEQKQQMSIDKCSRAAQEAAAKAAVLLEETHKGGDMLNFNKPKTKTSYLDRIKSKVKHISDRTFHKKNTPEALMQSPLLPYHQSNNLDLGSFTSVTSAGVFSKHTIQQQITPKVIVSRKASLTKSQIDSSEYIQKMEDQVLNSFTDYEKARHNEYQLNIFSGQHDPEPVVQTNSMKNSDSFGIERAETKNDWIQEWAKNARRNTKKKGTPNAQNNIALSNVKCNNNYSQQYDTSQATSSSDFSDVNSHARLAVNRRFNDSENFTDDMQRFEMRKPSSRPQQHPIHHLPARQVTVRRGSLSGYIHSEFGDDMDDDKSTGSSLQPSSLMLDPERMRRDCYQFESKVNTISRPPLSPTKIPSPMHSLARARSSSVNRSLHSSITVSNA